jgi:hypothetical protein
MATAKPSRANMPEVVADRGVEEAADVGELHDVVELPAGLRLGHAQDRGVQVDAVAPGQLRWKPAPVAIRPAMRPRVSTFRSRVA